MTNALHLAPIDPDPTPFRSNDAKFRMTTIRRYDVWEKVGHIAQNIENRIAIDGGCVGREG